MKNPLISIIVPIYNSGKYLPKCIDSIINQTYQNFEVILIDDGSNDNSLEICNYYHLKDKRIKSFSKVHSGVSASRNVGIRHANGEYLMFVDSDDYISKNLIERIISINTNNEKVIFLLNKNNSKKDIEELKIENPELKKELVYDILGWKKENKNQIRILSDLHGNLYLREYIEKNNIEFDENLTMGEDMLFNMDVILNANRYICLYDDLYHVQTREDSITRRINKEIVEKDLDFHINVLKRLEKMNDKNFCEMAKIRLALGGIICCCNSYFFKAKFKNLKKYIKELDLFVGLDFYNNGLKNMNKVKNTLNNKEYIFLFLLKNKKYYFAYMLKKISAIFN